MVKMNYLFYMSDYIYEYAGYIHNYLDITSDIVHNTYI